MANIVENKYYLKTVHEEISLYDRKLAHLLKYDSFDTDEHRETAVSKLTRKRDTLVKTAQRMAAEGVEFKNSDLPKSMLPEGVEPEVAAESAPATEQAVEIPAAAARIPQKQNSIYAGTSLDAETSIRNYMMNKRA